jgi:hypothetical protein
MAHEIGPRIFLFSGFISLVFIGLFTTTLFFFTKDKFVESKKMILFLILGIFALVNLLYFTNIIPPIPLSLKDAGVYHSIERNADGNYAVTYEDHGWRGYFDFYPDFSEVSGTPIYAYSAIFSPKDLNIVVVHQWQYFDTSKNKWITESTIRLSVIGGRDGGFRTYSSQTELAPGKWRVNIETDQGQTIGRLRFTIVSTNTAPVLTSGIKQ